MLLRGKVWAMQLFGKINDYTVTCHNSDWLMEFYHNSRLIR